MSRKYTYPELTVVKINGKVDFDNPPAGITFNPVMIRKEDVECWDLDPAYVTVRLIGRKKQLVFMEPSPAAVTKLCKNTDSAEDMRQHRATRCIITNPKTGNAMICPTTNSCCGCPLAGKYDGPTTRQNASLEQLKEDSDFEPETDDYTSKSAISHIAQQEVDAIIRKKSERLGKVNMFARFGYKTSEIATMLSVSERTVQYDLKQIERIRIQYERNTMK